jgi:hypothetical protein
MPGDTFRCFCERYRELEETCYRASVAQRAERGRFRGRYTVPAPLLKKLDLDEALERLHERFFGPLRT